MEESKKVIFCNIAWMKYYLGAYDDDKPVNGGSFVNRTGTACEDTNFIDYNHKTYGYVRVNGNQIHIERLGKVYSNAEKVDGVTVVWGASNGSGKSKIVGWYKNATVYRYAKNIYHEDLGGLNFYYSIEAKSIDCYLLSEENRTFVMPRASQEGAGKGMGQASIWFAESRYAQNVFIPKVLEYIKSFDNNYDKFYNTYLSSEALSHCKETDEKDPKKIVELAKKSKTFWERYYYINTALKYEKTVELLEMKEEYLSNLYMFDESTECLKEALLIDKNNTEIMYKLMTNYTITNKEFLVIELGNRIIKILKDDKNDLFYDTYLYLICFCLNQNQKSMAQNLINEYEKFNTDYELDYFNKQKARLSN